MDRRTLTIAHSNPVVIRVSKVESPGRVVLISDYSFRMNIVIAMGGTIMIYTNKAFVLRKIYDRTILMPISRNLASSDPILLNEVAADIWETAEKISDRQTVVLTIANMYGLSQGSPEMEAVIDFLDQLIQLGLLKEEV